MKNQILEELNASKQYEIKLINETKLVELSQRNVAIIEAMIRNDSAYLKSSDINQGRITSKKGNITYSGSTAYWMNQLKLFFENLSNFSYDEIIENAIIAVDRDNSTHLNADKIGRIELKNRLLDINENELLEYLQHPQETNYKLISILAKKTHAETKARENLSFASKFCHYACFYLYPDTQYQDNYSIYDNVLKKILPDYLDFYIPGAKLQDKNYQNYQEIVDLIRVKGIIDTKISRNGFDHLLWYYYKGRS